MLYAAIDIHKHAFQAAVLDLDTGETVEARFSADRESLARWAEERRGRVGAVAIEATTGWRWVWRELSAQGFEVRLAEPVQARALLGRRLVSNTFSGEHDNPCHAPWDRMRSVWKRRKGASTDAISARAKPVTSD